MTFAMSKLATIIIGQRGGGPKPIEAKGLATG
jgi:hypothetical protein